MTGPAQLTFEEFCQRLLSLFDEGRFNATYKYAVLIGLLDVLSERVGPGGELPDVLHTRELARAVLELYWPHARAFPIPRFDENGKRLASAGRVLRQNNGGQAEVLSRIGRFLESIGGDASAPVSVERSRAPERFEQLVRFVEFKLIEMPLGKLQFVGELHDPFIYDLDWDREHPPPLRVVRADGFDGVLRLRPGVAAHLLRAAALVRPLVQREWALAVSSFNDGLLGDDLDEFLFGAERVSLTPVRAGLRELAASRCSTAAARRATALRRSTTSCRGHATSTTASRTSSTRTLPATTPSAHTSPPKSISNAGSISYATLRMRPE